MTCGGKRKDGKPCGAHAVHGTDRCYLHSEGNRASLLGKQGRIVQLVAQQTARPALPEMMPPATAQDIRILLANVIIEIRSAKLDCKVGNSIALLAGTLLRAIGESDIEQRLSAVEAALRQKGLQRVWRT